jgi:hypothetical protein
MARFFGASSPSTIWITVDRSNTRITDTGRLTARETPAVPSRSARPSPTKGSATYPTSSTVTVMPSCAPESMNDSRPVTTSARAAAWSPSSARRRSLPRSTAT